jgi:hypothetical protein
MEPNLLQGLDLAALDDFMQREYGAGIHQLITHTGNAPGDDLIPVDVRKPTPFHMSLRPGRDHYDPRTRTFYLSLEDFFPASHCTHHQHQSLANADHCLRIKGAQTTQEFQYMGYSDMNNVSHWSSLIAGEQYRVHLCSDADDLADWIQGSNIPILSA